MVLALRPMPATRTAPTALGSAAQMPDGHGPSAPERGHAIPVQPAVMELNNPVPVQPLPFDYGANDTVAPWPNADFMNVLDNKVLGSLPRAMQELMASCTSASLTLYASIPDALRTKIWAGEFIDLSLLIKPDQLQPHFLRVLAKAKPSKTVFSTTNASIPVVQEYVGIFDAVH